ncbi:MAG TPA: hypothetical protein VGO80_13920 [Solirubrobacteraceae bacterium]|nr:hypothetical protein [Solirubrobacteraceae bacterium]
MTSYIHGRRLAAGLLLAIAASAGASAVASTPAPHLEHGPVVTFDGKHLSKGLLTYVRFTKEVGEDLERYASGAPWAERAGGGPRGDSRYGWTPHPGLLLDAGLRRAEASQDRDGAIKLVIETGPRSSPARRTVTVHLRSVDKESSHQSDNPVLQDLGRVATHR